MSSPLQHVANSSPSSVFWFTLKALFVLCLAVVVRNVLYNLYSHPLSRFPGPRLAAVTRFWKAYIECILQKSFLNELKQLHATYGDVVRVGPNELHFAAPSAYYDIYNNRNRWDKEESLYHCFGEDASSFGFLAYREAKERRDAMSRMFSTKAIEDSQWIVRDEVNTLCGAFKERNKEGKASDLFYAYRCATMDVVTYLCYGQPLHAVTEPDFRAPLIEAMHASSPIFPFFRHFQFSKALIKNTPPRIAKAIFPDTSGLVRMQQVSAFPLLERIAPSQLNMHQLLRSQIANHVRNPESISHLPHSTTIYHVLLDPEAYRNKSAPSPQSLYEESQALMFGGGDTSASAVMIGTFHLLKNPEILARLRRELLDVWPKLEKEPDLKELEKMPYLVG
ncbi:MAG: hypothetical protein M1819_002644 [Sarea resinae]|nr:MAG: hypothetical protein M1819_002644 [Sarea resinae]